MRSLLIILFFVVVVGVLLATQDANLTNEVRLALPFLEADWTGPVLWMIAGWFGAGLALGYLAGLPGRLGAARRARKVEKELNQTSTERTKAIGHLNEAAPPPRARPATTEADEMQRLADEVARRTETVQRTAPPPPPPPTT